MRWTRFAAPAVAGLAVFVGETADATPGVYDAFADYSTTSNPTTGGAWTYGYESSLGGAFTPFAWSGVVSTLNMWAQTSSVINPDVDKNTTGVDYVPTSGPFLGIIFPGTEYLHMHPGQSGQYSVLRWTASAAGTYGVVARFRSLRNATAGASTDAHMLHNGSQFAGGAITGYYSAGDLVTNNTQRFVAVGDTIDFVVGYGTGGYQSDSTGIAATISLAVPAAPPNAPTNLSASYSDANGITLSWTDNSSDETGFRIERKPGNLAFALFGTTAADATGAVDKLLYPSTTYTYRVRSFNANGDSAWSNEASATTSAGVVVPPTPKAPSDFTAVADETTGSVPVIVLSWTDQSPDETNFEVERAFGGAAYARVAVTPANSVGAVDAPLHPGWQYTYRVRALSLQGSSAWSNSAAATVTGTIGLAVVSGTLTDSTKLRRDTLKLKANYVLPPESVLDPVAGGLELRLGALNAPTSVSIVPLDAKWKVKRTKATKKKPSVATRATWKSAKGASPPTTIIVDFVKRTLTATISGAEFPSTPSENFQLLVASGTDGGAQATTWIVKRPGLVKFK